ncbi:MAG: hypothetical protein MUD17_12020 [Gemmatimonadaceae bacterium]|jgi:hypothetical protein|nr:hypothetical protein [Gemmatimonadaceae bacterium]
MTSLLCKSLAAGWLLAAVTALPLTRAAAQPVGEGPLVLRLPVSARTLALGNTHLVSNDGDALFGNPALLTAARGLSASLQSYGAAATGGALANLTAIGSTYVGVGLQHLTWRSPTARYDDAVFPGATQLSDGGAITAGSNAFTLGVARTIKGLRLGASVKFAEDRLGNAGDGTVAFDLGLVRPMGPTSLSIVAQNLGVGPRLGGVSGTLPRRIGVGIGTAPYAFSDHWDLVGQAQLTLEGDLFVRPAGGMELLYVPVEGVALALRHGFRLPRERDESLVTAGLGLTVDRLSFDYALEPMRGGRPVSHRVGIRLR